MALSAEPLLLVLDEPTTNLDVTTEGHDSGPLQGVDPGAQHGGLIRFHNLG